MAILELKAARSWSLERTATTFLVTAATIASWLERLDEKGPAALVQLPQPPVNKFPEFVSRVVRRLKTLCSAMGRVKIAQTLARAGLHLCATTVGRMLKGGAGGDAGVPSTPGRGTGAGVPPLGGARAGVPPLGRPVYWSSARLPCSWSAASKLNRLKAELQLQATRLVSRPSIRIIFGTWTSRSCQQRPVSGSPGCRSPSQCWPFCWWVAVAIDHFSRRMMGLTVFPKQPTSAAMRAFLGRTIAKAGAAPLALPSSVVKR